MWGAYYPAPRRKSSTSRSRHDPPLSPTSPTSPTSPFAPAHPTYASAIAESPESAANPYFSPVHMQYPNSHSHAQAHLTPGLSRVEEDPGYTGTTARSAMTASGGSQAPLLSRDFASRPMVDRIEEAEGSRELHQESVNDDNEYAVPSGLSTAAPTIGALPPPEAKTSPNKEALLVPPPSVHDMYVSSFVTPLAPPDATPTQPPSPAAVDRPPIFRTASAPVQPGQASTPKRLLPSPLPIPKPDSAKAEEGTPIFDIFNADLDTPAAQMVHALKSHLEQVLSVQEEIAKLHLGLEGLSASGSRTWDDLDGADRTPGAGTDSGPGTGTSRNTPGSFMGDRELTPGSEGVGSGSRTKTSTGRSVRSPGKEAPETLAKQEAAEQALALRERGVDDIMEKLGTLSERLRTYHTLGTPRLSFPQPSSATPLAPSRAVTAPAREHDVPARPEAGKPSEHGKTKGKGISPPHIAVANLRGQHMPPSPLQQVRSHSTVGPSTFSQSMTTLGETDRHERVDPAYPNANHPYRSGRLGAYTNSAMSLEPDRGYTYSSASLDRERSRDGTYDVRNGRDAHVPSKGQTKDSNLSPLTLNGEPEAAGPASTSRRGSTWTFESTTGVRDKQRERGQENWVEHAKMKSPELNRDPARPAARRWVDSPVEMVDRSRPW